MMVTTVGEEVEGGGEVEGDGVGSRGGWPGKWLNKEGEGGLNSQMLHLLNFKLTVYYYIIRYYDLSLYLIFTTYDPTIIFMNYQIIIT